MSRDQQQPQSAVRALVKLWKRWAAVSNDAARCQRPWELGERSTHGGRLQPPPRSSAPVTGQEPRCTSTRSRLKSFNHKSPRKRLAGRHRVAKLRAQQRRSRPFSTILNSQGLCFPQNTTLVPLRYHLTTRRQNQNDRVMRTNDHIQKSTCT